MLCALKRSGTGCDPKGDLRRIGNADVEWEARKRENDQQAVSSQGKGLALLDLSTSIVCPMPAKSAGHYYRHLESFL